MDMSYEQWNEALAPKVDGAWNLHKAFLSRPSLDFLILASSLVTIVDQPGQGNYQVCGFTAPTALLRRPFEKKTRRCRIALCILLLTEDRC